MTIQEFSTEFDVLYNNVTSNQAPGLNEYEKSVFLTKAQSQLVNEYFNSRTDGFGGGFDGSQKRQYDFSGLVRVERLFDINTFKERIDATEKLDRRSKVFLFPQNYFLAVNEILSDSKGQYSVIPLSYSEYQRLMLKPYNFPVKRAAWRLLTDKKNCNYYRECVKDTNEYNEEVDTDIDYVFLSGWADQKRSMKITIASTVADSEITAPKQAIEISTITYSDGSHPKVYVDSDEIIFHAEYDNMRVWRKIICDGGWKGSTKVYSVKASVVNDNSLGAPDDEETIELLKLGFTLMNYYIKVNGYENYDWNTIKVATHTDGFQMCSAPSKFTEFQGLNGKTFTTEVAQIPMAEIIGKFSGEINYQLRYIRTLSPIILDNLDNYGTDLTIGGVTKASECELPIETHQEILERAVTLAKIAWQGGTATQAEAQQRNNN